MSITDPLSFRAGKLPLLISIPHAGTRLTPAVEAGLSDAARPLSDTDWHIPRLYDFAHEMGASIVIGNYSRLVVDLNRPEDDQPLYATATTGLFPETLFDGRPCFIRVKHPHRRSANLICNTFGDPIISNFNQSLCALKTSLVMCCC